MWGACVCVYMYGLGVYNYIYAYMHMWVNMVVCNFICVASLHKGPHVAELKKMRILLIFIEQVMTTLF